MSDERKILIIAGPNGAGKTTFARAFLPQEAACPIFINADLIAAGLAPFAPETAAFEAGRIMLESIAKQVKNGHSFAFETTLSGRGYAREIPRWQALGYRVELFFLTLPSAEFAIERVAQRVKQGGHYIPDAVIRRRFAQGLHYFHTLYKPLVDTWTEIDNASLPHAVTDWSEKA
jgi:predicted ABC-type ATPase